MKSIFFFSCLIISEIGKDQSQAGFKSQLRLQELSEDQNGDELGTAESFKSLSQSAFDYINPDYTNLCLIDLISNLKLQTFHALKDACTYSFHFFIYPSLFLYSFTFESNSIHKSIHTYTHVRHVLYAPVSTNAIRPTLQLQSVFYCKDAGAPRRAFLDSASMLLIYRVIRR